MLAILTTAMILHEPRFLYTFTYIWSGVWRSHPPPPPQMVWSGKGGRAGGPGMCGEWSGRLGGVLLWAAKGHKEGRDITQALRKP